MAARCPNKNSKEWQALLTQFTEEQAYMLYDRNGENIPSLSEAFNLLQEDTIEFSDTNVEEATDAQEAFIAKYLGSMEDSKDSPNKYKQLVKTYKHDIQSYYKQISLAYQKLHKTKDPLIKRELRANVVRYKQSIEKLKLQIEQLAPTIGLEDLFQFGNEDLAKVEEILNQPNLSIEDLETVRRLTSFWSKMGDFHPDNNIDGHMIFSDAELKSERLKNGYTDNDGVFHPGFSQYKQRADALAHQADEIRVDYIRGFMEEVTNKPYSAEDVKKALKDLGFLEQQFLDLSRMSDDMLQAVAVAINKAEVQTRLNYVEKSEEFHTLLERVGKLDFEIFRRLRGNGKKTDQLIDRFTIEYNEEYNERYQKAKELNSKEGWENFNKWKRENTITLDVNKFINIDGTISNIPEAQEYIQMLEKHLGAKGLEIYLERQLNKITEYNLDKEAEFKNIEEDKLLSEKEKILKKDLWEKRNSPFIHINRLQGEIITVEDGIVYRSDQSYNVTVPKRFNDKGELTGFYDERFDVIENNEDLNNLHNFLHTLIRDVYNYLDPSLRQSIDINSMPAIEMTFLSQMFSGINKLGARALFDEFKRVTRDMDRSSIISEERDLKTGAILQKAKPSFINRNKDLIENQVNIKSVEYKQKNGKEPTIDIIKSWRNEIMEDLIKKQSWDIEKTVDIFMLFVEQFKQRQALEGMLNQIRIQLGVRGELQTNASGRILEDSDGSVVPVQGHRKANELYDFTVGLFLGKPKHLVEGKITESFTKEEKDKIKVLDELLNNNQEQFDKNKISEAVYKATKNFLTKEKEKISGILTGSSIANSILKYTQLMGMGFNVMAGAVNMGIGFIDNVSWAERKLDINPGQLMKAYKDVLLSLFKKGSKISKFDKKYDVTKQSANETYDRRPRWMRRRLKNLNPYIISERTEYINQVPVALAYMRTRKAWDADGNLTNAWDAYDDNMELKKGYKLDEKLSNHEAMKNFDIQISQIIKSIHGNYSDPMMVKQHALGRILTQFRTWMPEAINRRFGIEKYDLTLNQTVKGRYRSWGKALQESSVSGETFTRMQNILFTLKQMGRKMIFLNTNFDQRLSPIDAANMRSNLWELQVLIGIMALVLSLKAVMPDDDEKRKLYITLINLAKRLRTDVIMYANPMEYEQTLKNLFPIMTTLSATGSFLRSSGELLFTWDDAHAQRFRRNSFRAIPGLSQIYRIYTYGDKEFQ